MNLAEKQIDLIEDSFARVAPIGDEAARAFYARLFEMAPELRPMFRGDMVEQGRKLVAMLTSVVHGLRETQALLLVARHLARRHVGYGVRAEHYAPVGQALLDTLAGALGETFTAETRAAWVAAYRALSGAMIDAAYPKAA